MSFRDPVSTMLSLGRSGSREHLGESKQRNDAMIVDAADSDADIFVSEDIRARTRYAALRGSETSMNLCEFCKRFLVRDIKVAGPSEE